MSTLPSAIHVASGKLRIREYYMHKHLKVCIYKFSGCLISQAIMGCKGEVLNYICI